MEFHERRFPGESDAYRAARNELLQAEVELRHRIEQVARQRRRLPTSARVKKDYVFDTMRADDRVEPVTLSSLFAPGKNSLIVYSYMYGPQMREPCPMCTSLIDGLVAMAPHVTDRVNMVVVAQSPIERIMQFVRERRWRGLRFLSASANTYSADYWAEDAAGNQFPMLNVFVRKGAEVQHFWGSEQLFVKLEGEPRHVDLIWPLWNLFDLTPDGRGTDWYPRLWYEHG